MFIIAQLASKFVVMLERLKGDQVFVQAPLDSYHVSHLVGHSLPDYEIHIYCHRKRYYRLYRKWKWLARSFTVYRVFSVITGNAPSAIVAACDMDIDLPAQLPSFVNDNEQRMKAVNAYLDLVLARLSPPPPRSSSA